MDRELDSLDRDEEDFDSIDLDKELMDTQTTKFQQDKQKDMSSEQATKHVFLSPGFKVFVILRSYLTLQKLTPFSRKITENTDNTKAESVHKISDKDSKHSKSRIKFGIFELESLPSGKIFQTKSDGKTESRSVSPEQIKNNDKIIPIISKVNKQECPKEPNCDSKQQSDAENSELKETADFFRPSPDSFLESTDKKLSFGIQKSSPKFSKSKQNLP